MPVAHHFCGGAHLILPIVAALLSILRAQPGWSERGGGSGSGMGCATFFPMLLQMQTGSLPAETRARAARQFERPKG